jgi:hypothetical protein
MRKIQRVTVFYILVYSAYAGDLKYIKMDDVFPPYRLEILYLQLQQSLYRHSQYFTISFITSLLHHSTSLFKMRVATILAFAVSMVAAIPAQAGTGAPGITKRNR